MNKDISLSKKLSFLFQPHRYKVMYGGRGSGKSWGVARALLILGTQKPLRIVCTREVQKSIKQSVHTLLRDQISELGLSGHYEVLETVIRGRNGTEISFAGLSNQTVDSIKSMESVDICWCEEAQTISKTSWKTLIPTIRKPGSEIWITFNPELDSDETYVRFVINTPPDSVVQKLNYNDNPGFSDVMEQERIHCLATAPEDYKVIWEGECRPAVEGAIYAREIAKAYADKRVCNVPYDPYLKVHCVYDLGWNDKMVILMIQKSHSEIRIIDVIQDNRKSLDEYVVELNSRKYNWGLDFLPHDGFNGNYLIKKSAADLLRRFGRSVPGNIKNPGVPRVGVEAGIRAARMLFPRIVFDKEKTILMLESVKRYKRDIDKATGVESAASHKDSHHADALRYLALVVDRMHNESDHYIEPVYRAPSVSNMGY